MSVDTDVKQQRGKQIPVLFERKEDCCGCSACYAVCPKSAIKMQMDDEGFSYPHIDESICVKCYRCISVCAFKKSKASNLAYCSKERY